LKDNIEYIKALNNIDLIKTIPAEQGTLEEYL